MTYRIVRSMSLSIVTIAMAWPAFAQVPAGLEDLIGARGAGGETALRSRGYYWVRTQTGDDRKWGFWWNDQSRQCISVVTMDGRYQSIIATPAPDCGEAGAESRDHHDRHEWNRPRPDLGYRAGPAQREGGSYADGGPPSIGGQQVDLGLVCFGDGQRPGVATTYGWSWDHDKDRYRYGNRTELTTSQFDASLMIQLWDGGGRIRLPRKLIPPIHSRGQGDWWDLTNVSAGPDRVTAQYRLNGLNKPRITIDRRSGAISIVGTSPYAFRGSCDLIGNDQRRF